MNERSFWELLVTSFDQGFIRVYRAKLSRDRRSDPKRSCDDAVVEYSLIIFAAISILSIVLGRIIDGEGMGHFVGHSPYFGPSVAALAIVIYFAVDRRFGNFYCKSQELAEPLSRGAGSAGMWLYWIAGLTLLGTMFFLLGT